MSDRRVAVVTGGGQGIGRGVARRFIHDRFAVVVADLDAEAGREAEEELRGEGECLFVPTDVSREEDVRRLASVVRERFGRTDVLVNNAGIAMNFEKPLGETTLEEWQLVIGVNLTGQFLCAREFAPMLSEARGAIVNIASTRAMMSEPGNEAYAASKGGVVALTHALAMSLGPLVRVNCVSPGWIEVRDLKKKSARSEPQLTPENHRQHPAGRVGRPEDVASLVAWLASPEAGFATGANFTLDGGMTRKMIYV
ncbi:MAG TPA: glucose 1-dehydrogenase [Verrucomicrobiae bacterium]|nr:glucose 1-dehydrogenase [Verrucomicrobiae bacterium]